MSKRRKFIRNSTLIALGAVVADAFGFEKYFVEQNEYFINGATKSTANIKLVQLSDLHLRAMSFQHRQIAESINDLQPDIVLITGDAIDRADKIPLLDQFLKQIENHLQKVAILGNWEYWGKVNLGELGQVYAAHNGTLLINASKQFTFQNKTISITGVDDFIGGSADYTKATRNYQQSDFHVVLSHCPQYRDNISALNQEGIPIDFVLSGHTHGGQINLFGYTPFLPRGSGRYLKGWYEDKGGPKLYVSKGIGTSVVAARFMARAEMGFFYINTGG